MHNVYLSQMSLELSGSKYYYFPYSVGVIWCYAHTHEAIKNNFQLKEIMFRKEPIQNIVDRLDNPHVFGLSSYIWNSNYNLELAKAIKMKFPNCKIVVGGPDVPDKDDDYFVKHPYVDYLVQQEGEISFTGILNHLIGKQDIDTVPGISYNYHTKRVYTGPSQRITDLSDIPSPYTSGLFDSILETAKAQNIVMQGIMETNRGCPFRCTFCDWGGVTFSKVKTFDMTRIQQEIEWFAHNKIEYIHDTDANFGILKDRDMAITDLLIATKQKHGYPKIFDSSWNKNSHDHTVQIAKKLMDAGMLRRFTASLQSMNPEVLEAIKRVNLDGTQLDKIVFTAKENGLNITTELIVGLPKETYDSFRSGVAWLMENDFMIEAFPLTLFANSEMNNKDYLQQYGIMSEPTKTYFSKFIDEYQDMVVGTEHMPPETLKRVWLWTWLTIMLHYTGFTHLIGKYLKKHCDVAYEDFYEEILDYSIQNKDFPLHKYVLEWQGYADLKEFQWFTAGFPYQHVVTDIGVHSRQKFFQGLKKICKNLANNQHIEDVIALQEISQSTLEHKPVSEITTGANLYEYIEHNQPLVEKPKTYCVEQVRIHHPTWFEFINFSRKNGNWKAKIKSI